MPKFDPMLVVIGTRGSALALTQAHNVRELLETAHRSLRFEIKIIKTTGDAKSEMSLKSGSSKGLFTKELEVALIRKHIDLAVHSLKDLPVDLPGGLELGAVPKREDVSDILISRTPGGVTVVKQGAIVGSGSLRRMVQLKHLRHDLEIREIRGNVETRIEKLCEDPQWDAIVLAMAGLNRLNIKFTDGVLATDKLQRSQGEFTRVRAGLPDWEISGAPAPRIKQVYGDKLNVNLMLPAVGQGALGIETRANDERIQSLVSKINHFATQRAVEAERSFLRSFGGGCQVPLAAWGTVDEGKLTLKAVVFETDGTRRRSGELIGPASEASRIGAELAEQLK